MHDVVIAGGGPGGLHAGACLARRGFDIVLCEEHDTVGMPVHCTGVLAHDAFDEFALGHESVLNDLTTVRFHAPSGDTVSYTTPTVEAVVIDRQLFDRGLAQEASAAGVRVMSGCRVTNVAVDAEGVTVTTRDGRPLRAKTCVLACGASYALQQRFGLGVPEMFLQSAQAEVPCERLEAVEVHFGAAVAPSGFGWAVPVRRADGLHVRVGVMSSRDAAHYFEQLLSLITPRWGVRGHPAQRPRQKILPLSPIPKTFAERLLVLGDAAGLVKPTTGGGIYYSLVSAAIAADVLAEALQRNQFGHRALSVYEVRWRERLSAELRAQMALRRVAERLTDAEIDGLFELARTDGIMPIVRRTARFNRHRDLIVALFKHPPVRRIMFRALAG
jgi:digeranylgeranylglycerophospholipid reductase